MKVRFQADVNLNHIIMKAVLRREPHIDFQSAQTANLSALNDKEVLVLTARTGRLLVTHDRKTMPKHFAEFITIKRSSGVLIIPQKFSIIHAAEELILIWSASDAEEWINRIYSLPL